MECVSTSLLGPKYHWVHNGSLLSFSEANITLPSLAWEQMGRYRCIMENPVAQLSMYRDVEVQRPCKCSCFPLVLTLSQCLHLHALAWVAPVTRTAVSGSHSILTAVR